MTRPKRHPESAEPFDDQLNDFEQREYSDSLERALSEQPVSDIVSHPVTTVTPDTSIHDAMQRMDMRGISCVMVVEEDHLLGVFTERDVLNKVADKYHELKNHPVNEVMTADPVTVYETDPASAALCVIAVSGLRHVPVLDVDQKLVGVVSPRRVTSFLQDHFVNKAGCCE